MRCRRQWKKNGEVLRWNDEILHVRCDDACNEDDLVPLEGYYQCFVKNTWGTVVSNKTLVLAAKGAKKREYDHVRPCSARVGEKLEIPCAIHYYGFPAPTVDDIGWERDGIDIHQDQRLHFADTGCFSTQLSHAFCDNRHIIIFIFIHHYW